MSPSVHVNVHVCASMFPQDVLKVPDAMRIYLCWPTKTAATYIDQHYLQATAHLQSEFAKAYEHELAALRAKDEAPPSHEELTELLAGRLHELGFPVRDADKEGRFVSNPPTANQPTTTNANTTNPPSNMVQDVSMEQVATNAPANQDSNVQAVLGKQLTKADLKRMGEKVGVHWVARPRDRHPTLWHVRRRAMERMASHMGLPAAVLEGLLWVALQRGDACGSLTALARADPAGLSLPPELREPFRAWASLSDLTGHLLFYTLSEKAVCETVCAFVRYDRCLHACMHGMLRCSPMYALCSDTVCCCLCVSMQVIQTGHRCLKGAPHGLTCVRHVRRTPRRPDTRDHLCRLHDGVLLQPPVPRTPRGQWLLQAAPDRPTVEGRGPHIHAGPLRHCSHHRPANHICEGPAHRRAADSGHTEEETDACLHGGRAYD